MIGIRPDIKNEFEVPTCSVCLLIFVKKHFLDVVKNRKLYTFTVIKVGQIISRYIHSDGVYVSI